MDFLELIRLQCLFSHTRWGDIEVVSIVMSYADIAVSAGYPIASICFYQGLAYGF